MKDDLVEQCAAAVHFCRDDADAHEIAIAVLAIARPAILEEAAKVARDFAKAPASEYMRKGMGLSFRIEAKPLALQAIRIAAAIRALATTGQEGGR